jgi:hypothetical protein
MSFNQRSCVRGDNSQCQVRNAIYLKTSHTKYTQKQPTLEAYIFLLHHFEAPHPPRCSCATLIVSNHTNRSFLASGVNPPPHPNPDLAAVLMGYFLLIVSLVLEMYLNTLKPSHLFSLLWAGMTIFTCTLMTLKCNIVHKLCIYLLFAFHSL